MITIKQPLLWITLALVSVNGFAKTAEIDIPYQKFVLDNGLRVIVHEDHKAPIVAVSVWYNVGSKDEPEGKTGFAHLFEHLMYNGSENYNDEYFKPFHRVGATDMNGSTWLDRTNYFQNVPTPALDMALWMESDRMGHLLGAIDQAKLDEQRGVVQNEKRERDNKPYGKSEYKIVKGLFPPGHPYHHSTIGSMEDLEAASLDDVKSWFKQYYGAANAVVVLAGDITKPKAVELMNKYFGDIPAGPEVSRMNSWVPGRQHDTTEHMYEAVPQTQITKIWAVPGRAEKDSALLNLAARILGRGKNSRLYQELIYRNELASEVTVSLQKHLLSSQFYIEVTLKQGVDEDKVNRIIKRVVEGFINQPATQDEINRAKTGIQSATIRGLEKVGGHTGKAATLARGELYNNDAGFFKTKLNWVLEATAEDIQQAAKKWLSKGSYQLTVLPFPEYKVSTTTVDRSKGLPAVGEMPALSFPAIQRAELNNGIKVILASNSTVPIIDITMQFDAGFAADSVGFKSGTASYTLNMLDEGTKSMDALQLSSALESLGATIRTSSNLDMSTVKLSSLKANIKQSVALFADIIRNPAFEEDDIERLRSERLSTIKQEKVKPITIALRNLPPLLYGKDHAYGIPFTGSGTEQATRSLTQQDLNQFYQSWLRPDNATLIIAGDIQMQPLLALLNEKLGDWQAPETKLPVKNITQVSAQQKQVIIIDKPGAVQSLILAGELVPSSGVKNNIAIEAMNDILGGTFTARINMNLREDKHWSYGAFSFFKDARGQRPFMIYAPVQSDKTADSLKEIINELNQFTSDKPATQQEMQKTIDNNINRLPGAYETNRAVLQSLLDNERFNRPDNYVPELTGLYKNLQLADIKNATSQIVKPENFTWMIVGDREEIVNQIKGLDLGKVIFMNSDGDIID